MVGRGGNGPYAPPAPRRRDDACARGGARPKAAIVCATHIQTHEGDSRKKSRLFRMQGQSVALEPLGKNLHHTPRILLRFEVDNEVVGKTENICTVPQPRLHFLLEPEIQHVVEMEVSQQRREH